MKNKLSNHSKQLTTRRSGVDIEEAEERHQSTHFASVPLPYPKRPETI
jgi:hypothetical protein